MIKDVFDAPKTLELAVGRVELQRDVSTSIELSLIVHFSHVISDSMNGGTSGETKKERWT